MSSPLAIGAVSAVLRNLLDDAMITSVAPSLGSTVQVTAVAPDTIDLDDEQMGPRLNLFLHQVSFNPAWRNAALPSRTQAGERASNAPLALDLHYLLTAYGRSDFHAEILLGYAMHVLHERPWLDRASIRDALAPGPLGLSMFPPHLQALSQSDLADQMEAIKIVPSELGAEGMSRLWSAIQTHYRPSAAYQVSVVLIEGTRPARSPLPVLSRGRVDPETRRDAGVQVHPDLLPAVPTLLSIELQGGRRTARLGDTITVTGVRLAGASPQVRLLHRLHAVAVELPATLAADARGFSFTLPDDAGAQTALPAGAYQLSLRLTLAGEPVPRDTNALALSLGARPVIAATGPPLGLPAITLARSTNPARVRVTLASRPQVRPSQQALLMLGGHQSVALPRAAADEALVFDFPASLPAATYPLRLRVDGVDSELVLQPPGEAPVFDPALQVTVP